MAKYKSMSHLRGQVAIVTGGSSGIGFAIASLLLSEGMSLVIAARDEARLKKAADRLRGEHNLSGVMAVRADVSQSDQVEAMVKKVIAAYGRVDLLVNNAGIGQWASIVECKEAEWDQVHAVNLKGTFLCTRAILPIMRLQRSGYIVNIASVAGKTGFGGTSAYSASKFGVVGFTQSLLEEAINDNIRATAICPGYVNTPMVGGATVPHEEMIQPEEIGKLILMLLHLSPVSVIREIVIERRGSIGQ